MQVAKIHLGQIRGHLREVCRDDGVIETIEVIQNGGVANGSDLDDKYVADPDTAALEFFGLSA